MPLVKISMKEGRSSDARSAIVDAIQSALVEVLGVPDEDRYQRLSEFPAETSGTPRPISG